MKKLALKRFEETALGDELGFLVARSRAIWVARDNAAFAPLGLRARSFSLLSLAASGLDPTQRELADFLYLDASQIVALVDELEDAGLVKRQPAVNDRRTNIIVATPAGVEMLARAERAVAEARLKAGISLTDEEWSTLRKLLKRIAF